MLNTYNAVNARKYTSCFFFLFVIGSLYAMHHYYLLLFALLGAPISNKPNTPIVTLTFNMHTNEGFQLLGLH